jgi:hypothetical protein
MRACRTTSALLAGLAFIGCSVQEIAFTASVGGEAGGPQSRDASTGGTGGSVGDAGDSRQEPDGSAEDASPEATLAGPTLVYTAPSHAELRGISVSATDIYWVEGGPGGGIFRMPKETVGVPVQLRVTSSAYDVAVDADYIYWADAADFQVWRMPITGSTTTAPTAVLAHNSNLPRYLVVDSRGVVYLTTSTGSILAGSQGSAFHPYADQNAIEGVALDEGAGPGAPNLVWGYGAGIRTGPATGALSATDVKEIYTGVMVPVQGVAVDGPRMYWVGGNREIREGDLVQPSAGGARCLSSPQDLGLHADIAVDEGSIYFTWPSRNQIYKCPK